MWWTVGITLQSLSSTNIYYSLPHQKALKTGEITVSELSGELCSGDPFSQHLRDKHSTKTKLLRETLARTRVKACSSTAHVLRFPL